MRVGRERCHDRAAREREWRKKRRDQHEAGAETVLYLWLRGAHEQWYL